MRTLHVVVHPEATHHVEGLVGGWYDSDLTAPGLRDAEVIAAALVAAMPDSAAAEVYSSDLLRATRTARQIAARLGVEPIQDQRLREKSYGEAEGRPQAWLDDRFLPPPRAGDRMSHDEGIGCAETKAVFAERIYAAMDDILSHPAQQQVIVTHGFALTYVIAAWLKLPIGSLGYVSLRVEPGSITTLHEDDFFGNRQLVRLGDTRHLTGG